MTTTFSKIILNIWDFICQALSVISKQIFHWIKAILYWIFKDLIKSEESASQQEYIASHDIF